MVMLTSLTPNVVGSIHNHPGGGGPSAGDLLGLFDTALKRDNYKMTFTYDVESDIMYSLYMNTTDKREMNNFKRFIDGDIDGETNWFAEEGAVHKSYSWQWEFYSKMSDIDRQIYELAHIARRNGRCFTVTKMEKGKMSACDVDRVSIGKRRKYYRPVIYRKNEKTDTDYDFIVYCCFDRTFSEH